jgi:hypothetical protein
MNEKQLKTLRYSLRHSDNCGLFDESVSIQVPIDLELEYTKEKFDKWISELEEEKKSKDREEDLKLIEMLRVKYPEKFVSKEI